MQVEQSYSYSYIKKNMGIIGDLDLRRLGEEICTSDTLYIIANPSGTSLI